VELEKQKTPLFRTLPATILQVVALLVFALPAGTQSALAANPLIGQESAVVARTNAIRAEIGLPALATDSRLMRSATAKATDMATNGYFDHANPDGARMGYWINGQGYTFALAGENLAKGFTSIDRLMNAWVTSPTHYRNLVESTFTDIGIGMAEGMYEGVETLFVVQHFAAQPTPVAQAVGQLAAGVASVVGPLVESVAGVTDAQTVVNQPSIQLMTQPTSQPTAGLSVLNIPAAQAAAPNLETTPTPASTNLPTWLMLALIGLAGVLVISDLWLLIGVSLELGRSRQ